MTHLPSLGYAGFNNTCPSLIIAPPERLLYLLSSRFILEIETFCNGFPGHRQVDKGDEEENEKRPQTKYKLGRKEQVKSDRY